MVGPARGVRAGGNGMPTAGARSRGSRIRNIAINTGVLVSIRPEAQRLPDWYSVSVLQSLAWAGVPVSHRQPSAGSSLARMDASGIDHLAGPQEVTGINSMENQPLTALR